jgi:gamma-glutamylaminecyclotransferase
VHNIVVYGSLRRGFGNHRLLEDSDFIGRVTTRPEYTMLHLGGFPGLVSGGETTIVCELYSVDDDTLRDLDRLEGHPSFYTRTPIEVLDESGNTIEAEIYLLARNRNYPVVASGDWAARG